MRVRRSRRLATRGDRFATRAGRPRHWLAPRRPCQYPVASLSRYYPGPSSSRRARQRRAPPRGRGGLRPERPRTAPAAPRRSPGPRPCGQPQPRRCGLPPPSASSRASPPPSHPAPAAACPTCRARRAGGGWCHVEGGAWGRYMASGGGEATAEHPSRHSLLTSGTAAAGGCEEQGGPGFANAAEAD